MTAQPVFLVDPTAELEAIRAELGELKRLLKGATITPAPEWLKIRDAAKLEGVTTKTINRRIDKGVYRAKGTGPARRVKLGV